MLKITPGLLAVTTENARKSPRSRQHYNFHQSYQEPVQRLLNAMEPGSYFRPHNHIDSNKIEILLVLEGRAAIVLFDDSGNIIDHIILSKDGNRGVELYPEEWHMIIPLENGTVLYEIKEGPFIEEQKKVFVEWAPEEGSPEAAEYVESIKRKIGLSG